MDYFRKGIGGEEFINNKHRWCLWLGDCTPAQLRKMPHCLERARLVQEYRLSSKRASTIKLADRPTRFQTENMPDTNFIVIPEVTSGNRKYIPMGFMTPDVLCSNKLKLMPNAELFHFGVLTSIVHMAWMRVVCGRLGTGYDYSAFIVYNNFPWCARSERIEKTAARILEVRKQFGDRSLASLYDESTMPKELRAAHLENDNAVLDAYDFAHDLSEAEIVSRLMELYLHLTQ